MNDIRVGFALCGSFCTFSRAIPQIAALKAEGFTVTPIMSPVARSTDTRFGKSDDFAANIEEICGEKIIDTIKLAEPIGPKALLDILVIEPCTGNTRAKLANGIADTSVTMAAKAHLRNQRPLVIAVSTNDGLGGAAKNIGMLHNFKNVYFVPYRQEDPINKPTSLVADFDKTLPTVYEALSGRQIQPVLI